MKKTWIYLLLFVCSFSLVAQDKNKQKPVSDTTNIEPKFPGGEEARQVFLSENVIYPKRAREKGIQGKVFVSFVIEPDGSISSVKCLRGVIGGGLCDEAIRVVKRMPDWEPGYQKGKPVRVQFYMPINFVLDENAPMIPTETISNIEVDKKPSFNGGESAKLEYIEQNLNYPSKAKRKKIEGVVKVAFIVEESGSISNVQIIEGLGEEINEEVIRLIRYMPHWNPAIKDEESVRYQEKMEISFTLKKRGKKKKS